MQVKQTAEWRKKHGVKLPMLSDGVFEVLVQLWANGRYNGIVKSLNYRVYGGFSASWFLLLLSVPLSFVSPGPATYILFNSDITTLCWNVKQVSRIQPQILELKSRNQYKRSRAWELRSVPSKDEQVPSGFVPKWIASCLRMFDGRGGDYISVQNDPILSFFHQNSSKWHSFRNSNMPSLPNVR